MIASEAVHRGRWGTRRRRRRRRSGLSLVEILLAIALVLAVAIPTYYALWGIRRSYDRTNRREAALYLGQAVLDYIRYGLYTQGASGTDPSAPLEASLTLFFEGLREGGAAVASDRAAGRSRYFARLENLLGLGLHGITSDRYPDVYPFMKDFGCTIGVLHPATATHAGAAPDPSLCEVTVTVTWQRRQGGGTGSLALYTVLTSREGRADG